MFLLWPFGIVLLISAAIFRTASLLLAGAAILGLCWFLWKWAVNASGPSITSNCPPTALAPPPAAPLQVLGEILFLGIPTAVILVGIGVIWKNEGKYKCVKIW